MQSIPPFIGALLLICVFTSQGAAEGARLDVRASVQPWVGYRLDQRIGEYRVDAAALLRGHVDISRAAVVTLRSNQTGPFLLQVIAPSGAGIRESSAKGSYREQLSLSDAPHSAASTSAAIDCRVPLPEGVRAGSYPLNLQLELIPR